MTKDSRQTKLREWSQQQLARLMDNSELEQDKLEWSMVSGDASFRRYFRWQNTHTGHSWIAVDAPPEHENSRQFIKVANLLETVNAPRVLAQDLEQGFMLLTDLGNQLYLPLLQQAKASDDEETANELYHRAIDSLIEMQKISAGSLPDYDEALLRTEMELFRDWFLKEHLDMDLSPAEHRLLDTTFEHLIESAHSQPQVFVHRDYHSRNIMQCEGTEAPGIIDFQDAVRGPLTYDLLSLLRDCYIQWSPEQVGKWVDYYLKHSPAILEKEQFIQWFDWMGLQRHIKVAGIFCRLNYRDGKEGYLKDIPLTLTYIKQQAEKYPEMSEFYLWLRDKVIPLFQERQSSLS
ncbi:aminoglycoside phosphotransferase family protein [Kangiella sediminilitoris]|uniref:Aminoglycoside phosphotransferase n=1 Tax=Kangiella sediminilitoris TaxID=1144748 RepID=A0A1B3B8I8_9GAMM|nr:phosphotransferase [Kangiella sediminilitoris]AOE49119.1 Aminoglycoside phosphotransferase [Kangiella sediminilitoris]